VDRFQESLLLIARKNGKSELIAAMQLTELILGREGSDIVCSGMDDGTADLAYQAIDTMRLMIDPKQVDTWRNQKGIKCLVNGSHIYKLSASTRQREGRNIDYAGIDEVWSLPADGDIYKSIQQSTSVKENYKIVMFGSEGFVVDGFLDKKRDEYSKIIAGEDDTEAAKRKLPWMYTQDSEQEIWQTDGDGISAAWEKSNPSIGKIKKFGYLRDRVDEARKSRVDRVFVLCKDFNIKQATAAAWLMPEDYRYTATYNIDELRGCICLGAVDLSETTDMTSARVLIVRKDDNTRYILQHYWIPEGKLESSDDKNAGAQYRPWAQDGLLTICEGNDIDLTLVADWFYELYKQYGIMLYKCGYDVRFSREFVAKMESYGFECEVVLQSKQTLSNAVKLCENDFRSRLINYNENPVDMWTLGNAALEVDNYGNCQIVKIKGQPGKRIDGAVTYSIVYEMFRRYRSDIIALAK
jgi:phage terminase large subunit-like protein